MAPGRLKRLFRHKRDHSTTPSLRSSESVASSANLIVSKSEGRHTPEVPQSNSNDSNNDYTTGLWDDVYESYSACTESQDLKAVAKLLRDQSKSSAQATGRITHAPNGATTSPEWQVCNDILKTAQSKLSSLDDASTMSRVRRAYGDIITWVDKFLFIGDAVTQLDPLHVGIPWAGVRAILMISIQDHKTQAELAEKTADLSRLICRYAAFEDVYLRNQSTLPEILRTKLEAALRTLYMSIFAYLVEAVSVLRSSPGVRIGRSILMSERLTDLYRQIEKNEQDVLAFERLSIRAASHAQYTDVRAKLCTYEDHVESEKRREICNWISNIDCYSQHKEMRSRVLPYTGRWFTESNEYKDWIEDSSSSILWLKGAAGTGKTSLVSCVIEEHLDKPWLTSSESMAYFYCSRTVGDKSQQDPKMILLSILRQLSSPLPGLPIKAPVIKEYEKEFVRGSKKANMTVEESSELLSKLIQNHYEGVTLIVDALDECDSNKRAQLLEVLTRLTYSTGAVVKTLVSSRADPDIESHFSTTPCLSIAASDNAGDIARFIDHEIDAKLLNGRAKPVLRERVKSHLNLKAKGVFRWVALQVETLCDSERVFGEADVEYLLPRLPESLSETYSQILKDLDRLTPYARDGIEKTLKILIASHIPVEVDFLLECLNVLSWPKQTIWDKNAIPRMTRGLLTVELVTRNLIFAHLSVKEYLECCEDFRVEAVNALTAKLCLRRFLTFYENDYPSQGVQWYALNMVGVHCRDAGTLRQDPELEAILHDFFLDEGGSGFSRWNRDRFRINSWIDEESVYEELTASQSGSAQPLFMVCVYGLTELVEPIVNKYDHIFTIENTAGQRVLEVATQYGRLGVLEKLYESVMASGQHSIRHAAWVIAAAQSDDLDVWSFVLDRTSYVPSQEILIQAASNRKHGETMLKQILTESRMLKEGVICAVLNVCVSFQSLKIVRAHAVSPDFTVAMLETAVRNKHLNPELTRLILSERPDLRVSESCFLNLLDSWRLEEDDITTKINTIKLLINHPHRCPVTEEIVCKALHYSRDEDDIEFTKTLLEEGSFTRATESMLHAAATCPSQRSDALSMLLDYDPEAEINPRLLADALRKPESSDGPAEYLLNRPDCPSMSDDDVFHILESQYHIELYRPFVDDVVNKCKSFQITNKFLELCAAKLSVRNMQDVLDLPRPIPISQQVIQTPNDCHGDSVDMFKYLLNQAYGFQLNVTEDLLVQLLEDDKARDSRLRVLAEGDQILPITERVMIAAASGNKYGNHGGTSHAFELLLSCYTGPLEKVLTTDVQLAAVKGCNFEVLLYCSKRSTDFQVTERMLEEYLNGWGSGDDRVLKLLLSQPGRCLITSSIITAAVLSERKSALYLILDQPDSAALAIAMRAETQSEWRSNLFWQLEQYTKTDVSEEDIFYVLEQAPRKRTANLNRLLAAYRGPSPDFARLIEVAAGQQEPKFLVEHLRRRQPGVVVTSKALRAAAANETAPASFMLYMLNISDQTFDGQLLTAATGNPKHATQLVKTLLTRYPGVGIEHDTIMAALRNEYCGRPLLSLFLEQCPAMKITEQMIDAAVNNKVSGLNLLQILLQHCLASSSSSSSSSFSSSSSSSMLIPNLIFTGIKSIEDGPRDSLFTAACYGYGKVFDFLISQGVSVSSVSGELGTALNVAARANNILAARRLLKEGCEIGFQSKQYGTPFAAACKNAYEDMVQLLVEHGADVNQKDTNGRTHLHLAINERSDRMMDLLLSLGASVTQTDRQGLCPLHYAVRAAYWSPDVVDKLIKLGAELDAEDSYGWTALHWAAYRGGKNMVTKLLTLGAKKDKLDMAGKAPYDVAMLVGNFELRPHLIWASSPETALRVVAEDHGNAWCSMCDIRIRGPRFRCLKCEHFDLCFRCNHDARKIHQKDHDFEES